MTVTIAILNGREYVQKHLPEMISHQEDSCLCVVYPNDPPNPRCSHCGGTGKFSVDFFPFEMTLANRNFATLWNALGLAFDHSGEIAPHAILAALKGSVPDLCIRKRESWKDGEEGPTHVDLGIRPEQAANYFRGLAALAMEAERREEKVVWS